VKPLNVEQQRERGRRNARKENAGLENAASECRVELVMLNFMIIFLA